jgi:hypothetical protein
VCGSLCQPLLPNHTPVSCPQDPTVAIAPA